EAGPTLTDALRGPTEEEFQAWDRRDPAAEQHLYAWDKAHFAMLQGFVHDLECFEARMVAAGEAVRGAKPGSPEDEAWFRTKRALILELDAWQKQLFASHPRLIEDSKAVGTLLEAHELVMFELPQAYNERDSNGIDRAAGHWQIVMAKFRKYGTSLGERPTSVTDAHCKRMTKP
ncbi:MAG: hypothetical protein KDK70_08265, partial [Myxococcales bacterium]|nr:hypothetical protein [Myxococcales bacterium]